MEYANENEIQKWIGLNLKAQMQEKRRILKLHSLLYKRKLNIPTKN